MELLLAALLVKRHAGQINEIVHANGILLSLPHILEDGEVVEGRSLAALRVRRWRAGLPTTPGSSSRSA